MLSTELPSFYSGLDMLTHFAIVAPYGDTGLVQQWLG